MTDDPQPPLFKDSHAKVRRAEKHLAELTQEIAEWKRAKTPAVGVQIAQDDVGNYTIKWNLALPGAPDCAGVIMGDVIHNLRTALDLLASDMVRLAGESVKDVYFPFCDEAEFLDKMIRKRHFHLAGEDAVELLKSLAPYKGGNVLLRALHDLDVHDKHKAIIPHTAAVYSPVVRMDEAPGGGLIPVPVDSPPKDMHLNFPEDSALAGAELLQGLHSLVESTKTVLEAFTLLVAARQ